MIRVLVLVLAAGALVVAMAKPAAAAPGQRVDLRVLLLSADGKEPSYEAWQAALRREGVPYDTLVATEAPPLTAETLADGESRARYQAIILAGGELNYYDGLTYRSALAETEWAALEDFERRFGIRRLTAFAYPAPRYGLNYPSFAGDMGGVEAALTPAGSSVFPYLVGPVPIDLFAYGYTTTPLAGARFETLVAGPGGSTLAGVHTHPDGREDLVLTVDANSSQLHAQLLRHGLLGWVTRGVYLGHERNYLELHVDDIFLESDRWDTVRNVTPEPSPNPIRMTAADAVAALEWSRRNGVRLDMVFNGAGASTLDPLTIALLASPTSFGWINHTWSHPNLDGATLGTITDEIARNIAWARGKVPFDAAELVTGEHSGLRNPNMPRALADTGIRSIAADNSRQPEQYVLGPALTVPRHPTNVYYNVGTREEQLDEYNYVYLAPPAGGCIASPTNTCRTVPATWAEYVESEARIMLRHVLGNDPRPHYFHQANLAEDRVLYPVVDELLRRYRVLFRPELLQLTQTAAGAELARQRAWREAQAAGVANAYLLDGRLVVETTRTIEVPITGTSFGTEYGGQRSGWMTVTPPPPPPVEPDPPAPPAPTAPDSPLQAAPSPGLSPTVPAADPPPAQTEPQAPATASPSQPLAPSSTSVPTEEPAVALATVAPSTSGASTESSMPASTAIPTIVGKALVRQTLTAQTGRWSGMPSTFRFRWKRCAADRSRCRNVVGATSHRYRLVQRDIGSRIRVVVSASNLNGSSSTTAEATEVVRAAAPRATAAPTVTKIGRRLKAAPGRWIGLGKLRYSYSWQRCRPTLRTCTSIGGATGQHYRLTAADGGMHLRVIVRAASAGGSTRARSAVKWWRIGT